MAYLDSTKSAFYNLQLIANHSAYTTENEEQTSKAVLLGHYEAKRNASLTALITLVVLGIILGATVHSAAYAIIGGTIVPFGVWLTFRSKHQDLEKLHEAEYNKCIEILGQVTIYLRDLRTNKINLLLQTDRRDLQSKEKAYDQENNYQMVVQLANKALPIIQNHYTFPHSDFNMDHHPLFAFQNACSNIYGGSYNKYISVIAISTSQYGSEEKVTIATASSHRSSSVIAQKHTTTFSHSDNYIYP